MDLNKGRATGPDDVDVRGHLAGHGPMLQTLVIRSGHDESWPLFRCSRLLTPIFSRCRVFFRKYLLFLLLFPERALVLPPFDSFK
jgi:hypothetical protein